MYTTVTGQDYTYRSTRTGTGTDPIEVTYDRAHPGDAEEDISLMGMLFGVLIVLAMPGFGAAVATFFAAREIAVLWGD
ncbi:hypothetical protein ABZ760_02990 [Streptomyces sp. NPDC006658]|uniref:hypothetical protein n=1 Tax=Streptomyces sp. NPDC006658 TaxID=3156900 RepID=UPI0033E325C8